MAQKSVRVADLRADPRTATVDLTGVDANNDGVIQGTAEMNALFVAIDKLDHNGDAASIASTAADGTPTVAGKALDGIRAAARAVGTTTGGSSTTAATLRDKALARAFPGGMTTSLTRGAQGTPVLAVQYALGRLGIFNASADSSFGPKTAAAVTAFQASKGIAQTGVVDVATLSALDAAVSTADQRTPAAKAADPIAYLQNTAQFALSRVVVTDHARPVSWSHPQIRAAYGVFVKEYWAVCKQNRVESDCKTLALFLMDAFRHKVKSDLNVQLPLPSSSSGSIPARRWVAATASDTKGFFSRFSTLPTIRPGYSNAVAIQQLDPDQSMIYGVNVRYGELNADQVARSTTVKVPWDPARDNGGDMSKPEVPIDQLEAGDILFIDHTGDGAWDHTINVIDVTKNAAGHTTALTLAVGSFDDMKDDDGATAPNGLGEVNNYTEEVQIQFDNNGRVTGNQTTWSSEPPYLVDTRYHATSTLMERRPGGKLEVARWG
jgi:peptidoglycan hydrolase-like protein with peptidoglycan-binding domain